MWLTLLVFKMGLTTLRAEEVSILRAKSWKVVLKGRTVIFLTCDILSCLVLIQSSQFFVSARFIFLDEVFFALSNRIYDHWKIVFFWFPSQPLLGKQIPSSNYTAFLSLKIGVKQIKSIQEKKITKINFVPHY